MKFLWKIVFSSSQDLLQTFTASKNDFLTFQEASEVNKFQITILES